MSRKFLNSVNRITSYNVCYTKLLRTIVQQGFSVTPFVEGKIDIASVMRYNEYHLLFEAGLRPDDIIVFNFADFGMNIPEDAVFVHEKFRESHGDICEKFSYSFV